MSKNSLREQRRAKRAARLRNQRILLVIFLVVVLGGVGLMVIQNLNKPDTVTTASGLQYQELVEGKGQEATAGDTVEVHYTGWLESGEKFDSSLDRDQPFEFQLGSGYVIPGWDEGVQGMKVGGKRKLIIPPDLGYGASGAGETIPANATLIFEVELLSIK